jgi:Predicted permeases
MQKLIDLQLTMFILIALGLLLKKLGIVGENGKKNITDLVIDVILPCNIIKSFLIEFNKDILMSFAEVLIISIMIQILCTILGRILYNHFEAPQKKCLQYATICSNAGFLGNPVAEGVFGSMGLSYASIFLIPQRIVMWSAGLSYFTESPDRKTLIKKVATHPCIIACAVGLILMLTQFQLPSFLLSAVESLSSCNTAMSMLVIGMILAEVDLKAMFDKKVLYFTVFRLVLIPVIVFIPCLLLNMAPMVTGACVLLTAMPAGATTSILASKYEGDAVFATKVVVFSTVASLITTPIWSIILTSL